MSVAAWAGETGAAFCDEQEPRGPDFRGYVCTAVKDHEGWHAAYGIGGAGPYRTWPLASHLTLVREHVCTHCGQSWDNPDHVCACNMGVRHRRLAAEYVRQYIENCGPRPGDPFDADLWMNEAACLLGQIAGTP